MSKLICWLAVSSFKTLECRKTAMIVGLIVSELFLPNVALAILIIIIGAYLFTEGVITTLLAMSPLFYTHKKINLANGLLFLLCGAIILLWPVANVISFLSYAIEYY